MSAAAVLSELRRRGVELVAAGGRLRFRPVQAVSPDLVEQMRAHKAELLAILAGGERLDTAGGECSRFSSLWPNDSLYVDEEGNPVEATTRLLYSLRLAAQAADVRRRLGKAAPWRACRVCNGEVLPGDPAGGDGVCAICWLWGRA